MTDIKSSYLNASFDFRMNEVSFDELISHYERVGFLYPAKKKTIQNIMPLIAENWKKAFKAKDQLLWIASSHRKDSKKMSTISLWRSTLNGWVAQHLTSNAGPLYVKNILIGTQLHAIQNKYHAGQNWFQPKNQYANKVFGGIESSIGSQYAKVSSYNYYHVPSKIYQTDSSDIHIVQCKNNDYQKTLHQFIKDTMGSVYVETEEWDQNDIELSQVNDLYHHYGLFRYRCIWLAFRKLADDYPVAAIIAYRGPLGFNFSLIENRMELIFKAHEQNMNYTEIASQLIRIALPAYKNNYPLNSIPLVVRTDNKTSLKLPELKFIRVYNKSSWLNKGFEPWCNHVAGFFSIIENNFINIMRD